MTDDKTAAELLREIIKSDPEAHNRALARAYGVGPTPYELRRQGAELIARADAIEGRTCTGLTAAWCPRHGPCMCPEPETSLDGPECPLHAPDSNHASTIH